jgi:type II secretory pathway pseudopilin PulG
MVNPFIQKHPGNRTPKQAFTIIELLVVISIIVFTTGMVMIGFRGTTGSTSLTGDGDRISALVSLARQNAMARNALTALVLNTDPGSPEGNLQAVSIWEIMPNTDGTALESKDWKQISKWEKLRTGIVFMPPSDGGTGPDGAPDLDKPGGAAIPDIPVKYAGTTLNATNGFRYKLFRPSGGLLGDKPGVLQLAEGTVSAGASEPLYTNRTPAGLPANRYKITIIAATGHIVVERP